MDERPPADQQLPQKDRWPDKCAQGLRRRLVEISGELSGLGPMAFAAKHQLNLEADQLRNQLAVLVGSEMDKANKEWAERAGRKNAQDIDEVEASAIAVVRSHVQSGDR